MILANIEEFKQTFKGLSDEDTIQRTPQSKHRKRGQLLRQETEKIYYIYGRDVKE